MSINIEISYVITNILCLSLATLLLLRIKPEFSPGNSWGDKPIWNWSLGPRGSPGCLEASPVVPGTVSRSIGRPAGVDGDVVGPGVPRLGLQVLGLHVLADRRAGSMGEGGGAGSRAEGGTNPACVGSGHPHPALPCHKKHQLQSRCYLQKWYDVFVNVTDPSPTLPLNLRSLEGCLADCKHSRSRSKTHQAIGSVSFLNT